MPLTSLAKTFRAVAELGRRLVELHLLQATDLEEVETEFSEAGDSSVDAVKFVKATGRVCINDTQYFAGIGAPVWEHRIGGYQVCDKWLKDRKGRRLTFADITQFQRIVKAVAESVAVSRQLDQVIGKWPIA